MRKAVSHLDDLQELVLGLDLYHFSPSNKHTLQLVLHAIAQHCKAAKSTDCINKLCKSPFTISNSQGRQALSRKRWPALWHTTCGMRPAVVIRHSIASAQTCLARLSLNGRYFADLLHNQVIAGLGKAEQVPNALTVDFHRRNPDSQLLFATHSFNGIEDVRGCPRNNALLDRGQRHRLSGYVSSLLPSACCLIS